MTRGAQNSDNILYSGPTIVKLIALLVGLNEIGTGALKLKRTQLSIKQPGNPQTCQDLLANDTQQTLLDVSSF